MCGVASTFSMRAERVRGAQRLLIEDIDRRAGDLARAERCDQRRLIHDRAARGVDEPRRRLHQREIGGSDKTVRAGAQHEMDGEDVRLPEEIFFRDVGGARGQRLLLRQVLAPGDDAHAEGEADAGDLRADIAEAEHAQGLAAQIGADGALPAARAQRRVFGGDMARAREDQSPCEFDRRRRRVTRGGDGDAALGRRRDVDCGVAPSGGDDQPAAAAAVR